MSELYLILHKVRGEPAFDIGQKVEIAGEEGWIIPTSGHRAYPYWTAYMCPINESSLFFEVCEAELPILPPDLPDHYSNDRQKPDPSRPALLLSSIGLGRKIERRI